jgi:hypothetical protein
MQGLQAASGSRWLVANGNLPRMSSNVNREPGFKYLQLLVIVAVVVNTETLA